MLCIDKVKSMQLIGDTKLCTYLHFSNYSRVFYSFCSSKLTNKIDDQHEGLHVVDDVVAAFPFVVYEKGLLYEMTKNCICLSCRKNGGRKESERESLLI